MTHGDLTGRTLGEFVLAERIGEGGHGVVYRAHQTALGRDVVIKVLRAQRRHNLIAQERFLREAQLASLLDHPCAAHVYAFSVDEPDGLMWIAMELVHGITLHEWLASHGKMPLDQLVPFIEQVAEVVHAAHKNGIVHRDLKPSNMMVIECDGRLIPKLLDFGVAKAPPDIVSLSASVIPATLAVERRDNDDAQPATPSGSNADEPDHPGPLTRPGSGLGSSAYMAPEQWRDAWTVGPAADIYALGVIAYRALSGAEPFAGEHTGDYYHQHRDAQPPHLGDELAHVDPVLQRALAKSPGARHATALELATDLRAALRVSEREQLRNAAQQWSDRRRSPGLLWGREELPHLKRWARDAQSRLSPLECSFVAASQRHARRATWFRRAFGFVMLAGVVGGFMVYSAMRARNAEDMAAQAELEQGRSALLHGEPEALVHLAAAYAHESAPSTAFMLARAVEPRLAEQARFASSFQRMWSATFSPDARQVVTTDDHHAQLWDAQTNRLLFKLEHGDAVYDATYDARGSTLATACGDGAVRLWDPTTGRRLRELRSKGLIARYRAVAFSPDAQLVAALAFGPAVVRVWNTRTGELVADLHDVARSTFVGLAFSADGHWLAATTGSEATVFDTTSWKLVRTISDRGILSLAWDPTGPRLLTGSAKGDVSLWNIETGERVRRLRESGDAVDTVAFAPNGLLVAAGSRDGSQQVWDARSGELVSRTSLISKVFSIEFDRTSSLIVAGTSTGGVNVTDAASGMTLSTIDGAKSVIRHVHFDPSSTRVVGASWDGTARIWRATSRYRHWASAPVADDCGQITSLEPDRRFLAVSCGQRPTRVWDSANDKLVAELPSPTRAGDGLASAYPAVSVDGRRAAIARGEAVDVYDLPSARLLHTVRHGAKITAVTFASDGDDLISGAADGSLVVTRDNGTRIELPSAAASIDVVGFLAGEHVAAVDAKRHLRIYSFSGVQLGDLLTRSRVAMLRMSRDGRRLITTSAFTGSSEAPELWDVQNYHRVAELAADGQAQVYSTRFVANDKILTACGDGAARLWDADGRLVRTYRGSSRFLADATLSTDGTMIIGGGGGGQLRFWDVSSGRPLWMLQAHRSDLVGVHVDGEDIVTRGFSGDVARWNLPTPARVLDACARNERCAIVGQ